MEIILYLILVPAVAGLLCLVLPRKNRLLVELFAVTVSLISLILGLLVFRLTATNYELFNYELIRVDSLSKFIVLFIGFFGFLIVLYSLKYFTVNGKLSTVNLYYAYILWSLSASIGAVLSNNLVLLLVFWGFLGFTLYLLIQTYSKGNTAAKKTFIIIGGTDCFMIFGIAIIFFLTGTLQMDAIRLTVDGSRLTVVAFLCLTFAAFAKAGAMPFHTWIPDMAEVSPSPVIALLPASLDKLLGIYLLTRVCLNLFTMNYELSAFLMLIGAITIIAAVFMAMVQHDLRKLLSYHAVSQVGYMVLGIGTGNPIGIAGGIFHMLNHAIYKSCLFLCGGSVEQKTGTSDLDKLGGLAKLMPITFVTFLIAAFSISGVPPFNGFFSKWMIYQGLIDKFQISSAAADKFQIICLVCLVAAMFGSALTLASFMKLIHAIFFGQKTVNSKLLTVNSSEVSWLMWLPQIILASLCIAFGIFAFQLPLKYFIFPSLSPSSYTHVLQQQTMPRPYMQDGLTPAFLGFWQPGLATTLIIICLIIGCGIYLISKLLGSKIRREKSFIGGENLPEKVRVTGVDFYQTIKDIKIFKSIYSMAERRFFDIYDIGKSVVIAIAGVFSKAHTGNMHIYLAWSVLGIIILFFLIVR